jgi:hypothetical protein
MVIVGHHKERAARYAMVFELLEDILDPLARNRSDIVNRDHQDALHAGSLAGTGCWTSKTVSRFPFPAGGNELWPRRHHVPPDTKDSGYSRQINSNAVLLKG